ncbi:MAG: tetratricopeptide repeat protein [Alphaproteobacteria bacterium]|nr:tetratricopeptide repeat protein [Alphaproteobacteria bacterium]
MADIFQEVDEDLRHERYAKLWKKYGGIAIGIAVFVVLAIAVSTGWRQYQISQGEAAGEAFAVALDAFEQGDDGTAATAFAELAESAGDGYAVLARLQEAEARARAGDTETSVAILERVADDPSTDPIFRDLTVLLLALNTLDSGDPVALTARLQPLTAETSPWRYSAQELIALLAIRTGETGRARDLLTALSDDDTAPIGLRARATEILATLGG